MNINVSNKYFLKYFFKYYYFSGWFEDKHIITVDIEWLSRTVGQYQLCSIRPFMLCSEEGIEDLGYPSHLLAVDPDNFGDMTDTFN